MSRFNELLDGYLRDSLSESELQEFLALATAQGLSEADIREEAFDERHAGFTNAEQRERMLSAVQARMKTGAPRIRLWRAVAAAVVIVLATGGIYLSGRRAPAPVALKVRVFKQDVAPGRDGAILRLADGSEVVLDSAGNGVISQQGNTRVVKRATGQLVYEVQGDQVAVMYNTLTTAKGKQFRVVLPDGTKVWLNSFSSLHYPTHFTGGRRSVEITGETYFEVAPNAAMPFVVKTTNEEVTVLGTHFNVNAYEDEPALKTTLLEGMIRVSNGAEQVVLRPGQQASSGRNKTAIGVAEVNAEDAVAWKNGFFNFDNADIQTVMRQLARWYDVEVRYEGAIPTGGDLKGEIGRSLTLAQVLKILEQTRVHFRIEEDKRIVIFP